MRAALLVMAMTVGACAPPRPTDNSLKLRKAVHAEFDRSSRLRLGPADHKVLSLPGGDQREITSLLQIRRPLHYGEFKWNDTGIPPAPTWVRIDLAAQTLSIFRGGHEIGTGVILYGADSHPTPRGRFPVLAKYKDHTSSLYDARMPYTLRLTADGVAIHGSDVRRGTATHGCIGIPERFAAHVFGAIERGDPVFIVPPADANLTKNEHRS